MQQTQDTPSKPISGSSVSPQSSASPLIPSHDRTEDLQPQDLQSTKENVSTDSRDVKSIKRRFFGFGKTKEEKTQEKMSSGNADVPPPIIGNAGAQPSAKVPMDLKPQSHSIPISPSRNPHPSSLAASPSRLRSGSPRLHSPASSEIFERSVQEPAQISTLQGELSPAHIPAHVITEDHIPPALEASAEAITSEKLNPDEVEIVMSTSHQPAAAGVLESSTSHGDLTQLASPLTKVRSDDSEPTSLTAPAGNVASGLEEDGASSYGQLDPNDVRRLSFISFADVVQSEHAQPPTSAGLMGADLGSRDSLHVASLPSSVKEAAEGRAASPLRSPRSPGANYSHASGSGVTASPPPGISNNEQSPARSPAFGSPITQHGELMVETMRQAVRKTASGDLGAGRTAGMSPITDDGALRTRTNS